MIPETQLQRDKSTSPPRERDARRAKTLDEPSEERALKEDLFCSLSFVKEQLTCMSTRREGILNNNQEAKYLTVKEAAGKWGISPRNVRDFCRKYCNQIGAYKDSRHWLIPENTFPPYKVNDLLDVLKSYLRYLDNPLNHFPIEEKRILISLQFLIEAGFIERKNTLETISVNNLYIATKGWEFLFKETPFKRNRLAAFEFCIDLRLNPFSLAL